MTQHRPTLVPALFALSFAASCAASAQAVHAAECIAKPNAPAPQGEHWYYRTDRATMRQCWYLGPESARVPKGATQPSEQPASDVLAQPPASQRARLPTAPQNAQRPTAPEPTAVPAATEANVPAPVALPPWPETAKLPDLPPPAPIPTLVERSQSVEVIDPAPTSTSNPAKEAQSPANARSSPTALPAAAPAQATGDADHTLALATIAFVALVISGSVFHATRWVDRRKARNRRLEWPHPSTLNAPYPRAPVALDPVAAARHTPPPPKPLDQTERHTQALEQILNELQTKHHILQPGPNTLRRSSRPPVTAATPSDLVNDRVS